MGEFYELRNFMNAWSQQQELHESFVNRLYECKPVKIQAKVHPGGKLSQNMGLNNHPGKK